MTGRDGEDGFTLIEMSLALVIVGLVIAIVYPALNVMRQSYAQQATTANLQSLIRAAASFVQANGCLPCPTPASTIGTGFGRVRGDTVASSCGTCNAAEGIVPYVTLGLPITAAKDGWGHWITMRVDPALTVNFGVVPPTSLCLPGDSAPCVVGESRKGLCQDGSALSTVNRIDILTPGAGTQQAAILFLSHGVNGFGTYRADPVSSSGSNLHATYRGPATACSATGGYERCNANDDKSYVNAPPTNDPAAPFDDQMVFLDRNALVSYLGNPACQSAW